MRDLTNPRWMYAKVVLLVVVLALALGLILIDLPTWRTAFLLALVVWSAARAYYFFFYVIERYIDPSHRFSGIASAIRHLLAHQKPDPPDPA